VSQVGKKKSRKFYLILAFVSIWIAIGVLGIVLSISMFFSALYAKSLVSGIIGAMILAVAIAWVRWILKRIIYRIPFPEAWIIDREGVMRKEKPGYRVILLFFGYEKIYTKVNANIQYHIDLFPEFPDGLWIDLTKGGEIKLHDPRIWILAKDPLKAVTKTVKFEEQIREITENRMTGALNAMTYEDVMAMRKPKVMERERGVEKGEGAKVAIKKKIDEILRDSEELKKFLEEINVEYKGFTLDDFDFDQGTTEKRRERILTEMGKEIAKNLSEARKNEMSAIAKTAEVLQKVGFSKRKAQEISSERYQDHLVGEKGRLQKIIWPGGPSIPAISAQWEIGKDLLERAPTEEKKESKESRGKKTIKEAKKTAERLKK